MIRPMAAPGDAGDDLRRLAVGAPSATSVAAEVAGVLDVPAVTCNRYDPSGS